MLGIVNTLEPSIFQDGSASSLSSTWLYGDVHLPLPERNTM